MKNTRPPMVRLFGSDELIVDLFAGGGGASVGIERATGRSPDVAINHDREAISMHRVNHPDTQHYIENVWRVDPRKVVGDKRIKLMWLSPDCKHFSKAKGGQPKRDKKIRSLASVLPYWIKRLGPKRRPQVAVLENVEEFQKWGPLLPDGTPCPVREGLSFRRFVKQLQNLGYVVDFRELVCADYGAHTSRKRLFLIARCDGKPIVWPRQTHDEHGRRGLPKWVQFAECIDWTLECPSIFARKRPLAENTQRRIARGVKKYVIDAAEPFIVPVTHTGDSRVHGISEPIRTITGARRGEFALVGATLINTRNGEREGQEPRCMDIRKPHGTVTAQGSQGALVSAFLAKHNAGHEATGQDLLGPCHAITARDSKALVASSLIKFKGTGTGLAIDGPLHTVQASGNHYAEVRAFLMKYHRDGGQLADVKDPAPTIPTRDSLGLVTVRGQAHIIADIGMRMLQPMELFKAHDFPAHYVIDRDADGKPLTKECQVRMVGNSVPPPMAEAIIRAQFGLVEVERDLFSEVA